eukprot:1980364-Amphidinium_carterae.1
MTSWQSIVKSKFCILDSPEGGGSGVKHPRDSESAVVTGNQLEAEIFLFTCNRRHTLCSWLPRQHLQVAKAGSTRIWLW